MVLVFRISLTSRTCSRSKAGESQLPAGWDETLNGSGMEAEGGALGPLRGPRSIFDPAGGSSDRPAWQGKKIQFGNEPVSESKLSFLTNRFRGAAR